MFSPFLLRTSCDDTTFLGRVGGVSLLRNSNLLTTYPRLEDMGVTTRAPSCYLPTACQPPTPHQPSTCRATQLPVYDDVVEALELPAARTSLDSPSDAQCKHFGHYTT